MDQDFIRHRITWLRMQKDVSEYKMSLDLGHSKSYIQSISSGKSFPSMSEFLYICEYLGIHPRDFFDEKTAHPVHLEELSSLARKLSAEDQVLLCHIAKKLQN